jgi:hypothetical protein
MMQPVTLIGAAVCIGALIFRYKMEEARKAATGAPVRTRSRKQQRETAKLLFGALIALLAIHFALKRLNENLSGSDPDPSLMERVVVFLKE